MNKFLKTTIVIIGLMFTSLNLFSQPTETIEMADDLYQSGKIYVVVVVVAIIFIGIVGYLILLDKKISRLEKEIKNK